MSQPVTYTGCYLPTRNVYGMLLANSYHIRDATSHSIQHTRCLLTSPIAPGSCCEASALTAILAPYIPFQTTQPNSRLHFQPLILFYCILWVCASFLWGLISSWSSGLRPTCSRDGEGKLKKKGNKNLLMGQKTSRQVSEAESHTDGKTEGH